MTTIFTHAAAAVAIGSVFPPRSVPRRLWIAGAFGATLPDVDVVGFGLGVAYGDFWGHRGFTHSLAFAAIVAGLFTVAFLRRRPSPALRAQYLFLAIASHGVLDALTDGGLGVAFFSPFEDSRWFFPVRPIRVSPIGVAPAHRFGGVIVTELVWVWLPAAALFALGLWLHRGNASSAVEPAAAPARRDQA